PLLNGQRFAKGLFRIGRVVDGVVGVPGRGEVIEALQIAAAEATTGGAPSDQASGFRRWRCPTGDRLPAEGTQGGLERRQGCRDGVGGKYPTADRGRQCQMWPAPGASRALHQNGGGAVENPRCGRRAAYKARVEIGAPRPGGRYRIEAR